MCRSSTLRGITSCDCHTFVNPFFYRSMWAIINLAHAQSKAYGMHSSTGLVQNLICKTVDMVVAGFTGLSLISLVLGIIIIILLTNLGFSFVQHCYIATQQNLIL